MRLNQLKKILPEDAFQELINLVLETSLLQFKVAQTGSYLSRKTKIQKNLQKIQDILKSSNIKTDIPLEKWVKNLALQISTES